MHLGFICIIFALINKIEKTQNYMKPNEYIKKYRFDTHGFTDNRYFDKTQFMRDFTDDFLRAVEKHNRGNLASFKQLVKQSKQKWDAISNKCPGTGLDPRAWAYFYATVIIAMQEELYPGTTTKKSPNVDTINT